jgi:hypothetical protein
VTDMEVMKTLRKEFKYQNAKFGPCKEQSLPGFIAVMEVAIAQAKEAWVKNKEGDRDTPLEEIVKVVAVGFRCLQKYGDRGSAEATDDKSRLIVGKERELYDKRT